MKKEKVKSKTQLFRAFDNAEKELQAAVLKHEELSDLTMRAKWALDEATSVYNKALREYAPSVGIPMWKIK
jgi:hypothetical protein